MQWISSTFWTVATAAIYLFLIAPSLIVVPISFGDSNEFNFPPRHLSFRLYETYLTDPRWLDATLESVVVATGAMAFSLLLAVPAAYGLSRFKFLGARAVNFLLLLPVLTPSVVLSLGIYIYFSTIRLSGTTLGLILAHCVVAAPFVFVMAMGGLRQIDPQLEAAARIMGATELRILSRVVGPLLLPTVVGAALFAFLISFDEVVIAYFLTSPFVQTLPVKMYEAIQWELSPVLAAISTLLTVMSLMICLIGTFLAGGRTGRHGA